MNYNKIKFMLKFSIVVLWIISVVTNLVNCKMKYLTSKIQTSKEFAKFDVIMEHIKSKHLKMCILNYL